MEIRSFAIQSQTYLENKNSVVKKICLPFSLEKSQVDLCSISVQHTVPHSEWTVDFFQ